MKVAADDASAFRRALREAEFRRLITDEQLRAATGRGVAGALLAKRALGAAPVRNDWEDDGIDLLVGLGLPMPETNAWVPTAHGEENLDYWFPTLRLAIEFDGKDGHASLGGRMRDHSKAARLREAGIDLLAFNWWQATSAIHEIRGALVGAGYLSDSAPVRLPQRRRR